MKEKYNNFEFIFPFCQGNVIEMKGKRRSQENNHCYYYDNNTGRCVLGIFDGHYNSFYSDFVSLHLPKKLAEYPGEITKDAINKIYVEFDKMCKNICNFSYISFA